MPRLKRSFSIALVATISVFFSLRLTPSERDAWLDQTARAQLRDTLQAMGEPPLEPGTGVHTYRFTWLRSFHPPVAIRVVARDGAAVLDANELQRTADGALRPKHDVQIVLSAEQWSSLESAIDRSDFWHMPRDDQRLGFDGAQWILEGVHGYRVHTVYRWSPDEGDLFRSACLKLLEYSRVPVDPDDIY